MKWKSSATRRPHKHFFFGYQLSPLQKIFIFFSLYLSLLAMCLQIRLSLFFLFQEELDWTSEDTFPRLTLHPLLAVNSQNCSDIAREWFALPRSLQSSFKWSTKWSSGFSLAQVGADSLQGVCAIVFVLTGTTLICIFHEDFGEHVSCLLELHYTELLCVLPCGTVYLSFWMWVGSRNPSPCKWCRPCPNSETGQLLESLAEYWSESWTAQVA